MEHGRSGSCRALPQGVQLLIRTRAYHTILVQFARRPARDSLSWSALRRVILVQVLHLLARLRTIVAARADIVCMRSGA